jgi:glycosyltransferase involved in cell wall biosynthesis
MNCLKAWPTRLPLNVAAFQSQAMQHRVQSAVDRYEIEAVHAYRLRMAPYALSAACPIRVLDYTDALTRYFRSRSGQPESFFKRFYVQREARLIEPYEIKVSHQFQACLISSPQDRKTLMEKGSADLTVVTNGVDVKKFKPEGRLCPEPRLLFVGNMNYAANALGLKTFCRSTWPLILAALPNARLTVVGEGSDRAIPYPGVQGTGKVSDIQPYLRQARIGICPLELASGRQFKVIEYLASGLPAVVTPVVAENLNAMPDRHLLVAGTPDAFARQVVRLCQDDRLAETLRKSGRRFVEQQYDWSLPEAELDRLYQRLTPIKKPRRTRV